MQTDSIKSWTILPCTPERAYSAWLDSEEHGKMIQAKATIDSKVGGEFSIWEGGITGRTLALNPEKFRIVQEWRYDYDEWPKDKPSKITVEFVPYKENQTKVRLWHTGFPTQYTEEMKSGWKEYYWDRMKMYFSSKK